MDKDEKKSKAPKVVVEVAKPKAEEPLFADEPPTRVEPPRSSTAPMPLPPPPAPPEPPRARTRDADPVANAVATAGPAMGSHRGLVARMKPGGAVEPSSPDPTAHTPAADIARTNG